jgi:hypothetical protein
MNPKSKAGKLPDVAILRSLLRRPVLHCKLLLGQQNYTKVQIAQLRAKCRDVNYESGVYHRSFINKTLREKIVALVSEIFLQLYLIDAAVKKGEWDTILECFYDVALTQGALFALSGEYWDKAKAQNKATVSKAELRRKIMRIAERVARDFRPQRNEVFTVDYLFSQVTALRKESKGKMIGRSTFFREWKARRLGADIKSN